MVKGSAIWMNNKANRVGHMNEKDGKNRERERERWGYGQKTVKQKS